MEDQDQWRPMSSAPRNGSRIIVTVRPAEQGPAEVDVAYWARADRTGEEGWRAADSHPGCLVVYGETELRCWMPLPTANPRAGLSAAASHMPEPWEGDEFQEESGSGI